MGSRREAWPPCSVSVKSFTALAQLCGEFSTDPKEIPPRPEGIQQTGKGAAETSQAVNLDVLNWKKWKHDLPAVAWEGATSHTTGWDNPAGAKGGDQRARPSAPR